MRKSNGPRMDSCGTLQETTDSYSSGKILAMTLIDHGIRVLLVNEAGFRDPQCQKLFVKILLPCRYRNPCSFESGYGLLDM